MVCESKVKCLGCLALGVREALVLDIDSVGRVVQPSLVQNPFRW
jgi:hypothetical protein